MNSISMVCSQSVADAFRRRVVMALLIGYAVMGLPVLAAAYNYVAPIEFRADLVKIVDRADIVWDPANTQYHNMQNVQVSADGSTVLFNVTCEFCSDALGPRNQLFVVDADGTGLRNISDIYPTDIVSNWWGWGSLRINDDASAVLIRTQRNIGYYGQIHWYSYDLATGLRYDAVQNPFHNVEALLNSPGDRLYFSPYDAGWDEVLKRSRKGLFFADLGGIPQQIIDLTQLPCAIADCASGFSALNFMSLAGASAVGDQVFFAWNDSYGAADHWALYRAGVNSALVPLTGTGHFWVNRDLEPRGMCSRDGERALYQYIHRYGDPQRLSVIHLETGAEQPLTWTSSLNGFSSFMSRSGRYVLVDGASGDAGAAHYRTLFDLQQGTARDTSSYHLPSGYNTVSNLAEDDSAYYLTYKDGLYRSDLQPAQATRAPRVTYIHFDQPALLDADNAWIGIAVTLAADTDLTQIDRVLMLPIVAGRESPEWGMGRAPLEYLNGSPGGDFGYQSLFDDGTQGDAVAGDGVFSFQGIMTRKSGREPGWNSWYLHYPLPATVGVRIVVKDLAGHASLTDSRLLITDDPLDLPRQTAQRAYIGYYGRPADPAGLDYWSESLEAVNGDLSGIIAAFGNAPEYYLRFGDLPAAELISNLYRNLFNRDPEPAGLAFWTGQYESGAMSLQSIALHILYAAYGDDLLAVANKGLTADYFTASVRAGCPYGDIPAAAAFLAATDHTPASVVNAMAAIDAYCQ